MAYNRTTWQDSPSTSTPITAARMNNIETGILAIETGSIGVYTNEAARDTAITSPTEGMYAYLTAPTVPAATGEATLLPTGIQTVYNGTVWVCVTPVGTSSVTTGTATVNQSGTPTFVVPAGGTNCSVTISTGTSALVTINSSFGTGNATSQGVIGLAVTGASTIAPSLAFSAGHGWTGYTSVNYPIITNTFVITGLTGGANTFTMQFADSSGAGNTGIAFRIGRRSLMIQGIA